MKRSVHEAVYYIQTNEGIELSENSIKAIETVDKEATRVLDNAIASWQKEVNKIKYYNEIRLWAIRNDDQKVLTLINMMERGESLR